MMHDFHRPASAARQKQRGVALIASLIILLLMTIIGLSIMNGNRYFEKNAANTRDKQRALQAAQSALLYAEWWLNYGTNNVDFQTCSTTVAPTTLSICSVDPGTNTANLSSIQWFSYTPGSMTSAASNSTSGGVVDSTSTTSDVIYAQAPGIYINCISCGVPLSTGLSLYRITAIGYGGVGGPNGTVAIVQSVYAAGGPVQTPNNLSGP